MVLLGTVPVDDKVDALAFTPDSKTLIASDKDTFRAFNANTGEAVKTISAPKGVRSNFVLFTKDGKTMITANSDGAIRFYDWEKGEVGQTLEGHQSPMIGLVLSPSGKLLASSGLDRLVKVWDVETGKLVQEFIGVTYVPTILVFSDDEKTLTTFGGTGYYENGFDDATYSGRTQYFLWNIDDEQQEQTKVFDDFGPPYTVTSDGKTLIGGRNLKTKISSTKFNSVSGYGRYNISEGNVEGGILTNPYGIGNELKISPNKAVVFMYGKYHNSYLWGGATGISVDKVPALADAFEVEVAAFSPDSKILATWKDNLKVNIYRAP